MVAQGTFREDLYFRLNVVTLHLPPLRERLHDIPALATHFALRAAKRFGLPPCVPTPDDLGRLAAYPWPGNVRELEHMVEQAVANVQELAVGSNPLGSVPTWVALPTTWRALRYLTIPSCNLTAATAEQHAQWSRELNMLVQANEYHPPKFAAKPEPKYYNDAGTYSNVNTGGTSIVIRAADVDSWLVEP